MKPYRLLFITLLAGCASTQPPVTQPAPTQATATQASTPAGWPYTGTVAKSSTAPNPAPISSTCGHRKFSGTVFLADGSKAPDGTAVRIVSKDVSVPYLKDLQVVDGKYMADDIPYYGASYDISSSANGQTVLVSSPSDCNQVVDLHLK